MEPEAETLSISPADAVSASPPAGFPLAEAIWRRYGSAPGVVRTAAAAAPVYRLGGAPAGAWLRSGEVRARLDAATTSYAPAPTLIWPPGLAPRGPASARMPDRPPGERPAAPEATTGTPLVRAARISVEGDWPAVRPAPAAAAHAQPPAPGGPPDPARSDAAVTPAVSRAAPGGAAGSPPRGLGRGVLRRIAEASATGSSADTPSLGSRAPGLRASRIEERPATEPAETQRNKDAKAQAGPQGRIAGIPAPGVEPSGGLAPPPAEASLPLHRAASGTAEVHIARDTTTDENAHHHGFSRPAHPGTTEVATATRPVLGATETQRRKAAMAQNLAADSAGTSEADRSAASETRGAEMTASASSSARPRPIFRAVETQSRKDAKPQSLATDSTRASEAEGPGAGEAQGDERTASASSGARPRPISSGDYALPVRRWLSTSDGKRMPESGWTASGTMTQTRADPSQAAMRRGGALPLQRAVAEGAASAPQPPSAAVAAPAAPAASPGPSAEPGGPTPDRAAAELSPADLERVADAVYAIIERRLIAERENLGL